MDPSVLREMILEEGGPAEEAWKLLHKTNIRPKRGVVVKATTEQKAKMKAAEEMSKTRGEKMNDAYLKFYRETAPPKGDGKGEGKGKPPAAGQSKLEPRAAP